MECAFEDDCITVNDVKLLSPPRTPEKIKQRMKCVVINKSPIRETKYSNGSGSMFSMNLCSEPSSTIRAVCFNEEMFDKFNVNTTYTLDNAKVKQGYGQHGNIEILLDNEVKFEESPVPIHISECNFKIAQIMRKETKGSRFINVKAKVLEIGELYTVGTDHKLKRVIQIGDETGTMQLDLWRDAAKESNIKFKENDTLELNQVVVSVFNGRSTLTITAETSIKVIDETIEVSHKIPIVKSSVVSMETCIMAIKDFKTTFKCIGCRKDIPLATSDLLTCQSCSTTFLKEMAEVSQSCSVLLQSNKQWLTAKTGVRIQNYVFEKIPYIQIL